MRASFVQEQRFPSSCPPIQVRTPLSDYYGILLSFTTLHLFYVSVGATVMGCGSSTNVPADDVEATHITRARKELND